MTNAWYECAPPNLPLAQGDIILRCPVAGWKSEDMELTGSKEDEILRGAMATYVIDAIVMTQACDLAQNKVRNVIVCPTYTLTEYKATWEESLRSSGQNVTAKAWRSFCDDICDGYQWNQAMLNGETTGSITVEHRIVDFHEIFSVPKVFLESLITHRNEPRIRLLPPYREHLSQAFARYFMRVGLPVNVTRVWR